ncbi:MAG: MgtC/SapB family protein [Clostridiales bacterium]|nr:MgtC/SapB family protein [Clostridiales bacterium]
MLGIYDPIAKILGEWSQQINAASVLFRIILSVVFSAVIGLERSSKRHSAGLRTFILVSLASSISMIIDLYIMSSFSSVFPVLSAATIIGTAMISGNSILFSSRNQIKGLTTSAGLWTCGIIGLAAGAGLYTATLISFVGLLTILAFFPSMEKYLKNRSNHFEIHLELKNRENLQDFTATIRRLGLRIDDIESNTAYIGSGLSVYSITLTISSEELKKYKTHSEIIEALGTLDYVCHIEEMN